MLLYTYTACIFYLCLALQLRGSDQFQTTSNEAYNVVRGTGGVGGGEGEYYEVPVFPTTAAAGNCLYEPI